MADATISKATATWNGNLMEGQGVVKSDSGVVDAAVTWAARTGTPEGKTTPEELIASAHATCYAMAFSHALATAGNKPEQLTVTAEVSFSPKSGGGFSISDSALTVVGKVPGMSAEQFASAATEAEKGCPVSNALRGNVNISVNASLAS